MQLDFFLSIVFEIDVEYGPIIIKFFLSRFEQSWKEKKSPTKKWANTFFVSNAKQITKIKKNKNKWKITKDSKASSKVSSRGISI